MKFSTKTTYGLRAMTRLSKSWGKGSVSLAVIAKDEALPPKYLEGLFAKLKKAKLVTSEKGASGGYLLASAPNKITVFDIVSALEGSFAPFHCVVNDDKIFCKKGCQCGATSVLAKVQKALETTLKATKLNDLV